MEITIVSKNFLLVLLVVTQSCAVKDYYQVHRVKVENGIKIDNQLLFEDKNCKITYDLWGENGNVGFFIYNKTSDDIVVDLSRTFFIKNGIAYPYYTMRKFSTELSGTLGESKANLENVNSKVNFETQSHSYIESYDEPRDIVVPPQTQVNISRYEIVTDLFRNCSFSPSDKATITINFLRNDSPFVFYNRVAYSTKSKDSVIFENKFYVEAVSNVRKSDMYQTIDTNKCGKKYLESSTVLRNLGPDHFYIPYTIKK